MFEADPEQIKRHLAYVPIEISDEIGYKGRPNVVGRMKARESAGPL